MKIKTRKFKNKSLIMFLKQAALFYADQLIPKHKNKIQLNINACNIEADGCCSHLGDYEFEIEINQDLSFEHKMITLAHEMVHLKQFTTKQLKSFFLGKDAIDIWNGDRYTNTRYDKQPWEKEASQLEEELYHQFLLYSLTAGTLNFNKIKQIDKQIG